MTLTTNKNLVTDNILKKDLLNNSSSTAAYNLIRSIQEDLNYLCSEFQQQLEDGNFDSKFPPVRLKGIFRTDKGIYEGILNSSSLKRWRSLNSGVEFEEGDSIP